MKKLILSVAIVAAAIGANAQMSSSSSMSKSAASKPVVFSIGVDAAVPFGSLGDVSSFGIGGSAEVDYNVDPSLALTLNAGYIKFLQKNNNGLQLGIIPIEAGIKYSFTPMFYGSAQLGTGIFTGGGSSTSTFAYAPGVGYRFSKHLDLLLKYQAYSKKGYNYNTLGLRLAYSF